MQRVSWPESSKEAPRADTANENVMQTQTVTRSTLQRERQPPTKDYVMK